MAKNKEYTERGVREFYSVKGCHSCADCKHLIHIDDKYICGKLVGKTSYLDRRFPYDNTKCQKFTDKI